MPELLDLGLIAVLGFLGSFGHCVGMCGPLAAAFALSVQAEAETANLSTADSSTSGASLANSAAAFSHTRLSPVGFHLWLNLGRLLSYMLVGMGIGALGAVVFAGGQMAGVGSGLRRLIALGTGGLLVWFGLVQAQPGWLPGLPMVHPLLNLHAYLQQQMGAIADYPRDLPRHRSANALGFPLNVLNGLNVYARQRVVPLLLGLLWGLIPCGFLYAGQLRAAETQSWLGGAAVMLAFGLGTLPAMLAMGMTTAWLSRDRRSQLFRLGGWLTVVIGLLLLGRTGDTMSDYSGHGALIFLVLALVARPLSRLWAGLLRYRRVLGVGAFVLSSLHVLHMFAHTWNWQPRAVRFMLPAHQCGVVCGLVALMLMLPAALTSFDRAQQALGSRWRRLHLLGVPALGLAAGHTVLTGSNYWGSLALSWHHQARVVGLGAVLLLVLLVRSPALWHLPFLKPYYAPPKTPLPPADPHDCC